MGQERGQLIPLEGCHLAVQDKKEALYKVEMSVAVCQCITVFFYVRCLL